MPNKYLGDYPEQTYEEVPHGEYPGQVIEVASTYSSSGKYGMKIVFKVLADQYLNAKLWKYQYLEGADTAKTKQALGVFNGLLKKCGVPEEIRYQLYVPIQSAQVSHLLLGKTFLVKKYAGKPDKKTGKVYDQLDILECLDKDPKWELKEVEYKETPPEPESAEPVSDDVPF